MRKIITLSLGSFLFCVNLFAQQGEVTSYTAQKHKVDFNKQESKTKESLEKEYQRSEKLAQILENGKMKNDIDLKVAKDIITIDIWSNKFLNNYQPSQTELQELFKAEKPRVVAKYQLRNILVTYEENANKIMTTLINSKTLKEKQETFIKYVKSVSNDLSSKQKDGLTDLVDINKLNSEIKNALKDKKEGDIVKVSLKDVGTQIILIEKYLPEKDATFEEAKDALINLAKRKALVKEIETLLK
jgi:hypothetical protein